MFIIKKKNYYKWKYYFIDFYLRELKVKFMTNLFLFNETFTNGLSYDFLNIISIGAILCGIFVIISKNPIVSVLYLIGLFLNIAVYLMMIGIHFIGLSYLLVYVGAVSILFLFILMLINVRISELVTDNNNSIPLAILVGSIFSLTLYNLFPSQFKVNVINLTADKETINLYNTDISLSQLSSVSSLQSGLDSSTNYITSLFKEVNSNNDIFFATTQTWEGAIAEFSHITSIGNVIYTVYPMWLILTSLILLLAMVGAIVITIKQ